MSSESPSPHISRNGRQGILLHPLSQDYQEVWQLQQELCQARLEERCPDSLILVEHPPVFTLGRRSKPHHVNRSVETLKHMGYPVYEIERGGSVTYHGPGQFVGYPILRLRDYCPGPKAYIWRLEEVLINVLAEWGIVGQRVDQWRGVWVEDSDQGLSKIAAVGVRISRGITMHGFALNGTVDLNPFELITPCGIEGCRVTSMKKLLGHPVEKTKVQNQIIHHFGKVFELEWKQDHQDRLERE